MKDDEEGKLRPSFSPHLCDVVEGESGGREDKGGGKVGREQDEVCWSSCVLAVGGGGVVGIGQVRVSLPAGDAVQLRLHIAQTQLRT